MLEAAAKIIAAVVEVLKAAFAFFYVRRATKIEAERDALEKTSSIQKEQNDIANRPDADPDDLRQRMRDGKL